MLAWLSMLWSMYVGIASAEGQGVHEVDDLQMVHRPQGPRPRARVGTVPSLPSMMRYMPIGPVTDHVKNCDGALWTGPVRGCGGKAGAKLEEEIWSCVPALELTAKDAVLQGFPGPQRSGRSALDRKWTSANVWLWGPLPPVDS